MSIGPRFCDKTFQGRDGTTGGECWWVFISSARITMEDARKWCDDNADGLVLFGDHHRMQFFGQTVWTKYAGWVGFVFEDDAMLFYLSFA